MASVQNTASGKRPPTGTMDRPDGAGGTCCSSSNSSLSIAMVKDILIYITAFAAVVAVPVQLGGFENIFAAVPPSKLLLAAPDANTTGAYGAYATLALGSALALFFYPHSITGILSASSGRAVRRNAALLPGYSLMLGLLALVGFFAIAAGVGGLPEYAAGFKQFGNNFAVPALFLHIFPSWFVGIAFAAIGIGALVPARSCRSQPPISTRATFTANCGGQLHVSRLFGAVRCDHQPRSENRARATVQSRQRRLCRRDPRHGVSGAAADLKMMRHSERTHELIHN
jgi:hypothetical protein